MGRLEAGQFRERGRFGEGRQAIRATEIGGHPVAPKDIFIAPTWVVHRDRRWFDQPEAFRPERWEGDLGRSPSRLIEYARYC